MADTLYLIRHSETVAQEGCFVGSTDIDVTAEGLVALDHLVSLLPAARCYCSPMLRTRRALERLRHFGICREAVFDDRLQEIDFGRWEQKIFAEIAAADSDLLDAWAAYTDFIFPDGESVADFVSRVGAMLKLFRQHPEPELIIITHGGVIRTLICLALGLPVHHYLLFAVHPASLSRIALYSEGGVLTGLNQLAQNKGQENGSAKEKR